jgi:transcriptional regulator with XRE-family HTH domain
MNRDAFIACFSKRLNEKLDQSTQAQPGGRSKINQLAAFAGVSYQMARKYTLGLALPELHVISKIANWLNTSPSWLFFGENPTEPLHEKQGETIRIEPSLLKYILKKSSVLFTYSDNHDEIVNFIVDTAYDATHLNSDNKTIHKVIDMMISSATLLKNNNKKSKTA